MPKRQHGLDRPLEEERQIKARKLAAGDESNAIPEDPADPGSSTIATTVSLPSSSKAVQNDPKPESFADDYEQQNRGNGVGDDENR
ncbi:hypothetical protein BM221_010709 [Beauveria bassiana]|uniref:Uncharacterized protein n=1 Tax=Beauveria bassiana TaxID=176275 RepID=A0A2N6N892_BEABA|nr:hypothetical protein BM221_010709 [Beauveria bassiana]